MRGVSETFHVAVGKAVGAQARGAFLGTYADYESNDRSIRLPLMAIPRLQNGLYTLPNDVGQGSRFQDGPGKPRLRRIPSLRGPDLSDPNFLVAAFPEATSEPKYPPQTVSPDKYCINRRRPAITKEPYSLRRRMHHRPQGFDCSEKCSDFLHIWSVTEYTAISRNAVNMNL